MIIPSEGNSFDVDADVRVNTVNCVGVMGTGVALAFRKRYPKMFADYRDACHAGLVRPGLMHVWCCAGGATIVNFPTKRHWRDRSRYEDIEAGLESLRGYLLPLGKVVVTLPALGCGNGGLSWTRVKDAIHGHLETLDADIFLFGPVKR